MKKITLVFVLLLIFILTGCSESKTLLFTGQSVHWKGDYKSDINGNTEDGVFTFKFKKGGNPTFKNLNVNVVGASGHLILKEDMHQGSEMTLKHSGSGIATTNDNSVFKVTINWDNKYNETFFLRPSKYK